MRRGETKTDGRCCRISMGGEYEGNRFSLDIPEREMERRTMMKWLVKGIGLVTAALVGVPAIIAAFSPSWIHRSRRSVWRSIGGVDTLPLGEMRQIVVALPDEPWGSALRHKAVYAWRPAEQEVIVYSRSCTDLGCPLTYDPGSQCFFCPCHGGIFDKNGERLAGPPNRPMYRYAARITGGGKIEIDLSSVPPMA